MIMNPSDLLRNYECGLLSNKGFWINIPDFDSDTEDSNLYLANELLSIARKLNLIIKVNSKPKIYTFYPWMEDLKMADSLYFGNEGIPVAIYELGKKLYDLPGSGGLVRMSDGKVLILNDQATCTLKVASLSDATNWSRDEYLHPEDYRLFKILCEQELEPNNPQSVIEYTYRAFEPDFGISSPDGWMEITSRYTLHEVNGQFYQIGHNLNFKDISRPTDLRI